MHASTAAGYTDSHVCVAWQQCDKEAVPCNFLNLPRGMFPGIAEQVVPTLLSMQQEPAWPAIVAGHQPEDWPDSAPLPGYHQDLEYLSSKQAVSEESVRAFHSFHSFIWVCLK